MDAFNIYAIGVGGQGIGMLSEVLVRAADHAGLPVISVDTHGLAQRGGVVVSQIRIGNGVHSPLIAAGRADMVVALERHEALRAAGEFLRDGGVLVYYNTVWQPLDVRLDAACEVSENRIRELCEARGFRSFVVFDPRLEDVRMQNMLLLACLARNGLVPDVTPDHFRAAMGDLMAGKMLEKNLALFDGALSG